MKRVLCIWLIISGLAFAADFEPKGPLAAATEEASFDAKAAERFAKLALACVQGISEQDCARAQQRRGRGAAAKTDTGVLWLLRLALVGARALVARAIAAHVSRRAIRERCT